MRVALFTETFLPATDGVVTRLRHTIEELREMGDELYIFAPRYGEGPSSYAGVPIFRLPSVPFPPYPQFKLALATPAAGRAIRNFGPDVIHTVNPFILGPGAVYYARRLGVPLVASYHTNVAAYARYYNLGFLYGTTVKWTKMLHDQAGINLCTSEATRQYLQSEGFKNLRVWPQGVDARRFRPDRFSKKRRRKLSGGNPESKLMIFVGRLAPEKDIGSLRSVLEEVPGTRLAIVGDGPARRDLESEFAGTPTVFTGTLQGKKLARAYASADIFVFPSTTETLGMAMLEALASGLPVVAADSGATDEVVSHGESGLLFQAGSREGFVEAVSRVLSDEELRESLSRGARAAAGERSWEASTRALRGYYREALEG